VLELKPERLDVGEFSAQPLSICGRSLIADVSGALFWPGEDALIVADLHLEKGSSYAARGVLLPPYDTCETLERLAEAIDRFEPTTVICLGDSLHDAAAAERIPVECLESLEILQEDREWIWLTGNHDREIGEALGGTVLESARVAGLTLRHEPRAIPVTHEIAGHLHPAAKLSFYGHTIHRPCFVGNGLRLVVPAFGTYTGGLNVLDGAFEPLFGSDGFAVWVLGQEGLYPVATRLLKDD
jgi:DNA ligase-associated metallophosphoesterase